MTLLHLLVLWYELLVNCGILNHNVLLNGNNDIIMKSLQHPWHLVLNAHNNICIICGFLHLMVPPWILPLHYLDYAGAAKTLSRCVINKSNEPFSISNAILKHAVIFISASINCVSKPIECVVLYKQCEL